SDGCAAADRGDGEIDRQPARDQNQRRTVAEWFEMISKSSDEARMTNNDGSTNVRMMKLRSEPSHHHLDLVTPSGFDIRHSSLASSLIATGSQLTDVLKAIEPADRVAIDTEADSLHCYKEKLCLLQISVPTRDAIVDPLTGV